MDDSLGRTKSRVSSHTHIHDEANSEEYPCGTEAPSSKLTKTVAAKVTPETYASLLAIANKSEVTASSALRALLMRALDENAGNLSRIDSRSDGRR